MGLHNVPKVNSSKQLNDGEDEIEIIGCKENQRSEIICKLLFSQISIISEKMFKNKFSRKLVNMCHLFFWHF